MRRCFVESVVGLFMLLMSTTIYAGVTNFVINGLETGVQSTQGDVITWQYNLSVGGTADVAIWVDKDANKFIDPNIDFMLFEFQQTDGGGESDGPTDMDNQINGEVFVQMPHGLAVGHFVMVASEGGVADSVDFEILPLQNPDYTISGQVLNEADQGIPWILVEASVDDEGQDVIPNFWQALTDAQGNYQINMGSSAGTVSNWQVRIEESIIPNMIITPNDTVIVLTGNHSGVNFYASEPQMYISGKVFDENGQPFTEDFYAYAHNDQSGKDRGVDGSMQGEFTIGFTADDVGDWWVGIWSDLWGKEYMEPQGQQKTLNAIGDSLVTSFTVYTLNDTVWGEIQADGPLSVANRRVSLWNDKTGYAADTSDVDGKFMMSVSDSADQYEVSLDWEIIDEFTQAGYNMISPSPLYAVPGDTVEIIFSLQSDVKQTGTTIPNSFQLEQNFPNPIRLKNVSETTLQFQVPKPSHVTISVYNLLGQEVARLVDEMIMPGRRQVSWSGLDNNGRMVGNGIYFIRMRAPNFTANRKLLIVK